MAPVGFWWEVASQVHCDEERSHLGSGHRYFVFADEGLDDGIEYRFGLRVIGFSAEGSRLVWAGADTGLGFEDEGVGCVHKVSCMGR